MSDDAPLPEDDGAPKLWCWTTDKHPTFVRVCDYPVTREAAIKRLRDQQPADLNGATSVTLGIENRYDLDEMPIKPIGTVRVKYTESEQTNRMLASVLGGGFSVGMPGKSR
jgi:hypothetical protein